MTRIAMDEKPMSQAFGIARFRGFKHLRGADRWPLPELIRQLDSAIAEVDSIKADWVELYLPKFRRARTDIAILAAADGKIETVENRRDMTELAEWEVYGDALSLPRMEGLVSGHPILTGFARPIHTSLLLYIDEDQSFARTLSRYYQLGPKRGGTDSEWND